MPCGDRDDKKLIMSKEQRFSLMKQLFKTNDKLKVIEDEIELNRLTGKMVHTYDLMNVLKQKYEGYKFHLVFGGDIVDNFKYWGNYEKLLAENSFIFFHRKGYEIIEEKLPAERKIIIEDELQEISSTYIKGIITDQKKSLEEKEELIKPWLDMEVIAFLKEQKVI